MGPGQCALLCQRGLISLLETAAIGYSTEYSGNELRIIHQAEAVEELVLVAEVKIHPGVEGATVFLDGWRTRKVGFKRPVARPGIEIQQLDRVGIQAARRDDIQVAGCKGKSHRACGARSEGIAYKSARHCPRGRRIKNRPGGHGPTEKVGLSPGLPCDHFLEVGVAAASLQGSGHTPGVRRSLAAAQNFKVAEDKNLVLDHRSAGGDAELVQLKLTFFRGVADSLKVIRGIKVGIAEKFPARAMEAVGAGLDGGIQNRSPRPAVFRA